MTYKIIAGKDEYLEICRNVKSSVHPTVSIESFLIHSYISLQNLVALICRINQKICKVTVSQAMGSPKNWLEQTATLPAMKSETDHLQNNLKVKLSIETSPIPRTTSVAPLMSPTVVAISRDYPRHCPPVFAIKSQAFSNH